MHFIDSEDPVIPEFHGDPDSLVIPIAIPISYRIAVRYHRIKVAMSKRPRERSKDERKINERARRFLIQMMDEIEPELIAEGLLRTDAPVPTDKSA